MRFFLLLFLPALAAAQAEDAPLVVIRGQVVDAQTKRALSGVVVRFALDSNEALLAESDAAGRFRFEDVAPGAYRAKALRSGYQPIRSQAFEVLTEDEEQDIKLELAPSAVIAGRVLDALGRPVVGANVTAYQRNIDITTLEPHWLNLYMRSSYAHTFYRGVTNDLGEYRFWGLARGEYVLLAKPSPLVGSRWLLRFDAVPTFYPNSPTLDEATRLTLDAGDVHEGADIRLGPPVATRQTGRVIHGKTACGECGAMVFRKGREADFVFANLSTSKTGEIALEGLPPGEYVVGASARVKHGPRAIGLQEVVVSKDEDRPFTLALVDPITVRGRVLLEDPPEEIAEPVDENPIYPSYNVARLAVRPQQRDRVFFECQSDAATLYGSGDERYFELLAGPGLCRLSVSGPPGSYVAGMSIDGRPLERPEVRIGPEAFTGNLTVRVRFDVGEVRGRVEDAAADSWVYLIPERGDAFASFRQARVEEDGSFRVEAPPGAWRVVAGRSPNRFIRPETLLAVREGRYEAVRVEVESREVVELGKTLRSAE